MRTDSPLAVALAWQDAVNARDAMRLTELSSPEIKIVGPRGSGCGHQLLRQWLERAGLSLTTLRVFARGRVIVLEQQGIWASPSSGATTGARALATQFEVNDHHQVAYFARFDRLSDALHAAGLDLTDLVTECRTNSHAPK